MIVDTNKYKTLYLYNADLDIYKIFTFNVKESNDNDCDEFTAQEILGSIGNDDDMKITIFSDRNNKHKEDNKIPVVCTMYKESEGYKKFYVYHLFTNKEDAIYFAKNIIKEHNIHIEEHIKYNNNAIKELEEDNKFHQSLIKNGEITFTEKYFFNKIIK